jgi:uncharacterized protein (UPF0332 family)
MVKALFDYNECLKKGLIRKIVPSKDKARKSIEISLKWLQEAEKNFSNNALKSCLISSYLAVFHASRSILFSDGYREKSHACIARYLEENYAKKGSLEINWIEILDHIREIRHADQYNLTFFVTHNEAEQTINQARKFINRMKKLLEEKL